jgi:hypothetical protein
MIEITDLQKMFNIELMYYNSGLTHTYLYVAFFRVFEGLVSTLRHHEHSFLHSLGYVKADT